MEHVIRGRAILATNVQPALPPIATKGWGNLCPWEFLPICTWQELRGGHRALGNSKRWS